jgi:hypothetical protein
VLLRPVLAGSVLALAALLMVGGARAAPVSLRIGNHAAFGRVVILLPRTVHESMAQQGDQLVVTLPGAGAVPSLAHGPRNVGQIQGGQDQLTLTLAPGSHPRLWHGAHQVVVDVYGPPPSAPAPAPAPAPVTASPLLPGARDLPPDIKLVPLDPPRASPSTAMSAAPKRAASGASGPQAALPATHAPAMPPPPATDPVSADALVAQRLPPDGPGGSPAILLPFGRDVGAAAFTRGGHGVVVFDDSKPIDLSALKDDPVFGGGRVTLLQAATQFTMPLVTMPLAPGARLALHRRPEGWEIRMAQAGAPPEGAKLSLQNGILTIATHNAADTVVLTDPATGGRLLVGTVNDDDAGVSVPHVSPEFTLLPTTSGVVLVAQSDRLALRATKTGFALATTTEPKLAAVAGGTAERALDTAADLTRHFDFTPQPTPVLFKIMRAALGNAATAPRLARQTPRLHAAQAMMSLGMNREAAGTLTAALRDDSNPAGQADARALLAMAHFLSGDMLDDDVRAADALAMADPALGKSDEITLWRATLRPNLPDPAQAAASLSAAWRLLLAYPEPLRHRLAPAVARALLAGGQANAAQMLVDQLPDRALDGVRAALLARDGPAGPHTAEALALLNRMAAGPDRRQAAAAFRDATELRLAMHQITAAQAAEALDRHLYAWRDEETEIAQRLRIAALRAQAGDWRRALAGLRGTDALFPAAHDRVHAAQLATITGLLQAGQAQRLPALDLVALVEESADLLGSAEASSTLAPVLADKLVALDLPNRAAPLLNKLMIATAAPEPRAALGARLASLRLDQNDAPAALAALDQSDAPDLPATLQDSRMVLRARALAGSGQDGAALAVLNNLATEDSLEFQIKLLEKRNDWRGAETALRTLMHVTMPPEGVLSEVQQDLVLHLASDAARAGDMAALQQLQTGDARRLTAGSRPALFQALVQQPIQALADLPRSAREAAANRAIPAALASYKAR